MIGQLRDTAPIGRRGLLARPLRADVAFLAETFRRGSAETHLIFFESEDLKYFRYMSLTARNSSANCLRWHKLFTANSFSKFP